MLYTSGTTGRPKGVRLSHGALAATVSALEEAWRWRRDDRLLHVLPLHHTHGVVVALLGALWAGAEVRFQPFDAARRVGAARGRDRLHGGADDVREADGGVPRRGPGRGARAGRPRRARLRLSTSGSAALPATLLDEFRAATGQTILERYGMTEIGMALSNPYDGPRVPGAVGRELPGVTVDIVDDAGRAGRRRRAGRAARPVAPDVLRLPRRSPPRPPPSFDDEGRFRTGDTGTRDAAGVVRLLGRTSVDIIKSGGYKLSALEIEAVLLEHPAVAEVAVIGAPDPDLGRAGHGLRRAAPERDRDARRAAGLRARAARALQAAARAARCSPRCRATPWARSRSRSCARFRKLLPIAVRVLRGETGRCRRRPPAQGRHWHADDANGAPVR